MKKKAKYDRAKAIAAANANPGYLRLAGAYSMGVPGSPEQKWFDRSFVAEASTTTVSFYHLSTLVQGTTQNNRVGAKVQLTRVNCRFRIQKDELNQGQPGSGTLYRIILFIDKQANGNLPGATELLTTNEVFSMYNLNNTNRFIILKDKQYVLNHTASIQQAANAGTWNMPTAFFKYSRKLALPITYSGTTGAIGEVKSNNLVLALVSTSASTKLDSYTRIRFLDS